MERVLALFCTYPILLRDPQVPDVRSRTDHSHMGPFIWQSSVPYYLSCAEVKIGLQTMRLASLLLAVTAVLLASVNSDASVADTEALSQGNAVQSEHQEKRFLRTDEGNQANAEEGAEERGAIKLSNLDRLNTYLTPGANLPSGVKVTDIDRLNTRLAKNDKLPSGVGLTNADRLNTRLTRSADLQKLKYAIKLKKRLKTRLTQRLNRKNA